MTIVYSDPVFEQHLTGSHPETPDRLKSIRGALGTQNTPYRIEQPQSASVDQVAQIHRKKQIEIVQQIAAAGGGHIDGDTVLSLASYEVAMKACGTVIDAVDRIVAGQSPNALCLIRPPGHHATQNESMGFCLFNNVAVAANHALNTHGLGRVLIIDWDVHHGNGTQDIFYDSENVFFLSLHRYPFYPGTGAESETGTGAGLGTTMNVPLPGQTPAKVYLQMFKRAVEKAAQKSKPELILISAGFDAHMEDPIGGLNLDEGDFAQMTAVVKEVADHYCAGRIVSCLEGGYHLKALARSVMSHLDILAAR